MTQAFEHKDTMQSSNEDIVTQRKLRFLVYLVELAGKDKDWNGQLTDLVDGFEETEK